MKEEFYKNIRISDMSREELIALAEHLAYELKFQKETFGSYKNLMEKAER